MLAMLRFHPPGISGRLTILLGLAALLAGCEDPLAPDRVEAGLTSSASPGSSGITANAVSSSQVDLAWQDNSPNEAGFEVHQSATGAAFTLLASTDANATSYSNTGLTPATQYCYKVRAFKISGRKRTYSAFSDVACATTPNPPAAASNASAVPQNSNTVDVHWTDNSSNEQGFRVQRASNSSGPWSTVATTGQNATGSQDFVWTEQQVCYRVVAFAPEGEAAPSNTDCTAPPLTPTDLVARAVDVQTVELTWKDNSAVEDGYEVQRWDGALGQWSIAANLPANASGYRDTGRDADVTYWYLVRATKDGGYSYFSNYATAITASAPPNAPSGVAAVPYYSSAVSLYWTDNSNNEEGFRVQRGSSDAGPWETIATTGADIWYFYEEGLSAEQEVCYRIIAFNSRGDSSPSSDCTTPPAGPTALVATTVDHQAIDLSWINNSAVADSFVVLRYGSSGEYLGSIGVPNTVTSYRDAGLASSTTYWYWVVAMNDDGNSDYSNDAVATTDAAPATGQSMTAMAPRSGSAARLTPPAAPKAFARPGLPGSAAALRKTEPSCPSSAPLRHECPKPASHEPRS